METNTQRHVFVHLDLYIMGAHTQLIGGPLSGHLLVLAKLMHISPTHADR